MVKCDWTLKHHQRWSQLNQKLLQSSAFLYRAGQVRPRTPLRSKSNITFFPIYLASLSHSVLWMNHFTFYQEHWKEHWLQLRNVFIFKNLIFFIWFLVFDVCHFSMLQLFDLGTKIGTALSWIRNLKNKNRLVGALLNGSLDILSLQVI